MRLLEHQSKKLPSNFGLVFTESTPVESMGEVRGTVERVGLPAVLGAQTPFGGRGKLSQLTVVVDGYSKIDHQLLYPTLSQMLVEVDKAVGYVGFSSDARAWGSFLELVQKS